MVSETERIEAEAAGWVARLGSADATETDRAGFEVWQAEDARHAAAFAEFNQLWSELRAAPIPASRLATLRRRRAGFTALLLFAGIGIATILGPAALLRFRADAIAGVGEIRHMTLPDGSRLDLDSGAAVALDFDGAARRVVVLRGAVFAEAKPDPARPFTLESTKIVARALGTGFGIDGDEVVVAQGTVEARGGTARVTLTGGEGARLADGHFETEAIGPAVAAWREGLLVVSGRPLSYVLAELGRYRHGRVMLLDRAAGGRAISGVFDLADPDQALGILAEATGLRLTRLPGLTILR